MPAELLLPLNWPGSSGKINFLRRNTIEFIAFGAEELGLYGSNAYAAEAIDKFKKD